MSILREEKRGGKKKGGGEKKKEQLRRPFTFILRTVTRKRKKGGRGVTLRFLTNDLPKEPSQNLWGAYGKRKRERGKRGKGGRVTFSPADRPLSLP